MSIITSNGFTDTVQAGVTAPSITAPVLNFKADWRVKSETGKEVILINTTSPMDQSETIRYGFSEIANVYAKSGITSDNIIGSTKGVNVLAQITETIKVTDSTNAAFVQYLPISAHLVIKVPQSGYITPEIIKALIARLNATLYEDGVSILPSLTKGVLTPKAL